MIKLIFHSTPKNIVVTNKNPKNAVACYLRRWEIENTFCGLKLKAGDLRKHILLSQDALKNCWFYWELALFGRIA